MVARQAVQPQPQADPQQELANSLIQCMGRDSAIHVCQVNGWSGVLEVLLGEAQPAKLS